MADIDSPQYGEEDEENCKDVKKSRRKRLVPFLRTRYILKQ